MRPLLSKINKNDEYKFIRGVNLGGWLVMERYITPYSFSITDCHQRGDFCWYPGQIDAPPNAPLCNITECQAALSKNVFGATDYPLDEWHLGLAFQGSNQTQHGEQWLNSHFAHFLQKSDLIALKKAGISHVRVPLPHWILGNVDYDNDEPWIVGDRWKYFLRMCGWAREIGLEVWPNIHTAPGSQNGFDNSGQQNSVKTCGGWSDNPHNIQRSLNVLLEVAAAIKRANITDVVTGFGLLNEPFGDCSRDRYKQFLQDGMNIIRSVLGDDIGIYMSDLFQAHLFNDGTWGLDPDTFGNTYLDSHYYNIFAQAVRVMSPQEHIDLVCHPHDGEDVTDCCFEDAPHNTIPSQGTQRIVAEWSGAFDAMPGEVLKPIMKSIYEYGVAPLLNRTITPERKSFLTKFIQAQIVSYETAAIPGLAHGWFYWNFKMEGGAYLEWDLLKGVEQGWFPEIAPPNVPSERLYGTCMEIRERTNETQDIVHAYPWGDPAYWRGPLVNESDSLRGDDDLQQYQPINHHYLSGIKNQVAMIALAILVFIGVRRYQVRKNSKKWQYAEIQS
ncbi:Sporulation-specific glucan 1,3-beta-glucosidase [Seminavis robusta]|uniref:glucan 1,3-beta-glucosidase n=1 Tax=Seminavis robusta TaxID=568900 RepID=A0A9N8DKL8_9STRA|nr:Sporulation-specific glucan 1,3-beta-glucosidase [Seminavis robusta]|eukprot:Sro206_g086570.1 Sporulation-specific glucan 1,3-beta-glucosidase (557) ;mRNA; f:48964-50731